MLKPDAEPRSTVVPATTCHMPEAEFERLVFALDHDPTQEQLRALSDELLHGEAYAETSLFLRLIGERLILPSEP